MDSGEMPEGKNIANITPIFKGGEKCEALNYRSIALASHLTTTFEREVTKAILEHLALNNLLIPSQHGFTAKRFTLTQLIEYYSQILDLPQIHGTVDAIYLDCVM